MNTFKSDSLWAFIDGKCLNKGMSLEKNKIEEIINKNFVINERFKVSIYCEDLGDLYIHIDPLIAIYNNINSHISFHSGSKFGSISHIKNEPYKNIQSNLVFTYKIEGDSINLTAEAIENRQYDFVSIAEYVTNLFLSAIKFCYKSPIIIQTAPLNKVHPNSKEYLNDSLKRAIEEAKNKAENKPEEDLLLPSPLSVRPVINTLPIYNESKKKVTYNIVTKKVPTFVKSFVSASSQSVQDDEMLVHYKKYLKYKTKYLKLKQLLNK